MKILVTGKNGQLGSEFQYLATDCNQHQFIFSDIEDLDITNRAEVDAFFKSNTVEVLINCAAYTAVDKAETESELANAVNHLGVRYLAEACKLYAVKMIHISTDYVFDGEATRPYKETDVPNPQSIYGQTKLDGELALKRVNPSDSIIIRTSWLYSVYGQNFIKTMLRLGQEKKSIQVVNDQLGSPTNASDLANAILEILPKINNPEVQIFHYANKGSCTWYDFAVAVFEIAKISCQAEPIASAEYATQAKRPNYSVLDSSTIQNTFNLDILDWKASLSPVVLNLSKEK